MNGYRSHLILGVCISLITVTALYIIQLLPPSGEGVYHGVVLDWWGGYSIRNMMSMYRDRAAA